MSDAGGQERIDEAKQRLFQHPAYADYLDRRALYTALVHVFRPNYDHLMDVLDAPSRDQKLALELVQNVRRPDVRNAYEGDLIRSLHNHVASSRTLVDHARRVMRDRTGKVHDEFAQRRDDLARHGEVHFINGLRNFMLHRTPTGDSATKTGCVRVQRPPGLRQPLRPPSRPTPSRLLLRKTYGRGASASAVTRL